MSDTVATVELDFNGDIDTNGTLTFTVGAAALANYNGSPLTATVPVTAAMESVVASTTSPLTEATLNGSVVTLTLSGATYDQSIFNVRGNITVSGIAGVSVGTFGIERVSDTVATVELDFNGDIDTNGTLTFTVGAAALANYNGSPLTATVSVTAAMESVVASTTSPLTEATLDGSVVTLTLSGATYDRSIFNVRDNVTVSGIAGVSVGTFGVSRVSDTVVTVELTFNGNLTTGGTLTFTVGAAALANYNGSPLTATVPVTGGGAKSVVASTTSPLTEATLDGSVVTLTLSGATYDQSIFDVRDGVTVSGIAGVSVGTFGVSRVSDTVVTVELTFNGDFDANGTLTFTVGTGALANYNGSPLTAQISVSALQESVALSTPQPLTEATLNGSVVTLTLMGRSYESSIFDIRRAVTVSGIAGVSVGTSGIQRKSDTVVTVELTFNGNMTTDGTLTFTVGAGAIAAYNGSAFTATSSVTGGGAKSVVASTSQPLTEATLNGSVVTLTLIGTTYEQSIFDVRDGVTVSGIASISVGTFGIQRKSDTEVTVELTFNGNMTTDGTLTFTVGTGALANYNGSPLTAQISVPALQESVTLSTPQPLTEATLNSSVVTLTLTGRSYERSIFDIRRAVTVSGIAGVSVGTSGIQRKSDTEVTVELDFNGNMTTDGTLTFTVGAGAIAAYNGSALTATSSVTADSGPGPGPGPSPNQSPTFSEGASTTRSFAENTGAGQNIGNPVRATDSDGGTLTYSLQGTDAGNFTIVSNSGQLQTRTGITYDYETKNRYAVTVQVSDGQGGNATIAVTINLTDVNETQNSSMPELYWTDAGRDKIQRANLDGSNIEDLVFTRDDGRDGPVGLALDVANGKMYWTEWEDDKIRRANLDGSNIEDLITSGRAPVWLALDVPGGKIYWTDWGTDRIQRANLDGSNVENLVTSDLNSPAGLVLDVANGKMYWTDSSWHKIQRANLDGSNVEDLITSGLGSPSGLALDVANGKMYWTNLIANKIQRANLDGSNVEDLVTSGLGKPYELKLDLASGKMYWTNRDFSKIQRANLNGSNVEDLITRADGLSDPTGLALAVASSETPMPTGPCASGGAVPTNNPGLVSDCEALMEARDLLTRDTRQLNWSESTVISSWDGVTLGGTPQRVTKLNLHNKSLNGTVPTQLSRLTNLEVLHLTFTELTGPIPRELGNLTNLTQLDLFDNQLTGTIPPELGRLANLQRLALQRNQLIGTIPPSLGNLTGLRFLNLQENQLTGTIPRELGNLSALEQITLFRNQLTGTIPVELGNLPNLKELYLNNNQLTGTIPPAFENQRLEHLYLAGNSLTGCVPPQLRRVPLNDMQDLNLPDCGQTPTQVTADFNGDGRVDFADFFEFVDAFGGTDPRFDLDGNGMVDFADFFEFVDAFGS